MSLLKVYFYSNCCFKKEGPNTKLVIILIYSLKQNTWTQFKYLFSIVLTLNFIKFILDFAKVSQI